MKSESFVERMDFRALISRGAHDFVAADFFRRLDHITQERGPDSLTAVRLLDIDVAEKSEYLIPIVIVDHVEERLSDVPSIALCSETKRSGIKRLNVGLGLKIGEHVVDMREVRSDTVERVHDL